MTELLLREKRKKFSGADLPRATEASPSEFEVKFEVNNDIPQEIQEKIRETLQFVSQGKAASAPYKLDVISQGYVRAAQEEGEEKGRKIRVRESWNPITGFRREIANKKKVNPVHSKEVEKPADDVNRYREIWYEASKRPVRKIRLYIPQKGPDGKSYTVMLDFYLGALEGLVTAEVEFKTEDDAVTFRQQPIPWLGKDVCEDKRFGNSDLAKAGAAPEGVRKHNIAAFNFNAVLAYRTNTAQGVVDVGFPVVHGVS